MYNLMIVDDDRLIREDIKTLLDWRRLGYRVVKEASNGLEALDELRQGNIDVILTDIDMPRMDGVELIRVAKSENASLKFLVMSNYDDFTFVKDAMKYGASDYVLKYKLDRTLLTSLFMHLHEEIAAEKRERDRQIKLQSLGEQGRASLHFKFWLDVWDERLSADTIAATMKQLELSARNKAYMPVWIETDCGSGPTADIVREEWHDTDYMLIPVGEGKWVAVLLFDEVSNLYVQSQGYALTQQLKKSLIRFGAHSIVVRGEVASQVQHLPQQRDKLAAIAERSLYTGYDKVLDMSGSHPPAGVSIDESILEPTEQAILNAIYLQRQDEAGKRLAEWFRYMKVRAAPPAEVRKHLILLWNQLHKEMKKTGFAIRPSGMLANWLSPAGHRFCTIDEIERQVLEMVGSYFQVSQGSGEVRNVRSEISKAILYMEAHISEEINLNDVSEHVGLSKNHFCKLFKQETGDNFINYLNRIRIEQAKLSIMQTSQAIKQIADQVGMGNYRYFCKVFKQLTGKRPLEYKKSRLGV